MIRAPYRMAPRAGRPPSWPPGQSAQGIPLSDMAPYAKPPELAAPRSIRPRDSAFRYGPPSWPHGWPHDPGRMAGPYRKAGTLAPTAWPPPHGWPHDPGRMAGPMIRAATLAPELAPPPQRLAPA